MAKKSQISDWLRNNDEQLAWATAYLRKRRHDGLAGNIQQGHTKGVAAIEAYRARSSEGEELIRAMKDAWRKLENNKKGNRRSFSYTLPKDVDDKLEKLALQGDDCKSRTLQKLVERGFDFENEERKIRRAALAEEREAWKKRTPVLSLTVKERLSSEKLRLLKKEIEIRGKLLNTLLLDYARNEVLLGQPQTGASMDCTQEEAVQKRRASLQADHDRKLRAALDLDETSDPMPAALSDATPAGNEDLDKRRPAQTSSAIGDKPSST